MSDRYATVSTTRLGVAVDPVTRDSFEVVATKHANRLPGFEDENCFAVHKLNAKGDVVAAWGFTSPKDCFSFLSDSGENGYQVPDMRGELYTDVRTGFGIPDGLIKVYGDAGTTKKETPATNAVNV